MKNFDKILKSASTLLSEKANTKVSTQMEKYLKNLVKCRGLSAPLVSQVYKEFEAQNNEILKNLSIESKVELSHLLIKSEFFEEKTFGINILSGVIKKLDSDHINSLKELFYDNHINNWATCDSICGQILKGWTKQSKENAIEISKWSLDNKNVWIRRASCVTFINMVKKRDKGNFEGFIDMLFEICKNNIIYKERFNQLGTCWLLRELSLVDKERFTEFFYSDFEHFTREGVRYAIEKLDESERKEFLNYRPDK